MLRLAVIPGAICGGCDFALASLGEKLAELVKYYEIVYWPTVVDKKLSELRRIDRIDVLVHMGGISTEEEAHLAKEISSKAIIKVSFGTCSVYGGIPGLNTLYKPTVQIVADRRLNSEKLGLPEPVNYMAYTDLVEPDILVPGCPPVDKTLNQLLEILVDYAKTRKLNTGGKLFLLGSNESLCNSCPRNPKTTKITMPGIKRLYEIQPDEKKCFLEQGILCMGPATRLICDHSCIRANYPCTGCGGPVEWGSDSGLSMMSTLSSILMVDVEKRVLEPGLAEELDKIRDVVGSFYRYTLRRSHVSSIIKKKEV